MNKRRRGSIRQSTSKSTNSWKITIELEKDELTGKRKQKYYTYHGTRKEAEHFLTQKLNELDKGILCTSKKIKFEIFLDYWLDTIKINKKETTIEEYTHYIDKHIKPNLGKIYLQDLKKTQIQAFYNNEFKNGRLDGKGGVSPKTLKNIHNIIHSVLDMACNSDLISKNISNGLQLPKVEKYNAKFLEKEQLLELVKKAKNTDIYIPIALAIYTGMRRGEILGLSWDNINLKEKTIYVKQQLQEINGELKITTPKTKTSIRTIYISQQLVSILSIYKLEQQNLKLTLQQNYENNINAVCTYPSGKLFNPKIFSKKFKKFINDYGFPDIRFHDLRHSHASLLFSANVQDKLISERLGHSSTSTTKELYTHLYEKDKKNIGNIIENLFMDNFVANSVAK